MYTLHKDADLNHHNNHYQWVVRKHTFDGKTVDIAYFRSEERRIAGAVVDFLNEHATVSAA